MNKKLSIGLFGFGCVGQGLYQVLQENQFSIARIKKIVVKNENKSRSLPSAFFTFRKEDILNDPEIDVVVELIDDSSAAFEIVKEALLKGKAVVTANKKMLAENLREIYDLQPQSGKTVLYEGAVCGSIPVIRTLEEYFGPEPVYRVEGIFNGSTNYILTKMFEERKSFPESLREVQTLGFAESDPTLDVGGFDPKFKLSIVIAHAFGTFVNPEDIINIGIDKLSPSDFIYARQNKLNIKLKASAISQDGSLYAFVAPQFVDHQHALSGIRNEYNAFSIEGAHTGVQTFTGKGAGMLPTGAAVYSDLLALAINYSYPYRKIRNGLRPSYSREGAVDVLVSSRSGRVSVKDFYQFNGGYKCLDLQFYRGLVQLEKIHEWSVEKEISVILCEDSVVPVSEGNEAEALVA